jgi:Cdc6-like AAA superfamily ATPase
MSKPTQQDVFKACLINKKMADAIESIRQDLLDSEEFVADVASGIHRSALVYGRPGMGKTHLIAAGLNNVGKKIGKDYLIARSHITPRQFYAMLYLMRNAGQYVVLDDCDGVMSNEEGLNLLKAATDPTFRKIGWTSSSVVKLPDGTIIPSDFEFNGSVIIATNVRNSTRGKAAQHFAAIKSRCVSWAMNYDSVIDQFAYIYHLVIDKNYLDADAETALTWAQKVELLKFIVSNLSQCNGLDLRKPQHIARVIKNKPNNWQNHARRFLTAE